MHAWLAKNNTTAGHAPNELNMIQQKKESNYLEWSTDAPHLNSSCVSGIFLMTPRGPCIVILSANVMTGIVDGVFTFLYDLWHLVDGLKWQAWKY